MVEPPRKMLDKLRPLSQTIQLQPLQHAHTRYVATDMRLLGVREFVYSNGRFCWRTLVGMNGNTEIYKTENLFNDTDGVTHNAVTPPSTWQPSQL